MFKKKAKGVANISDDKIKQLKKEVKIKKVRLIMYSTIFIFLFILIACLLIGFQTFCIITGVIFVIAIIIYTPLFLFIDYRHTKELLHIEELSRDFF